MILPGYQRYRLRTFRTLEIHRKSGLIVVYQPKADEAVLVLPQPSPPKALCWTEPGMEPLYWHVWN